MRFHQVIGTVNTVLCIKFNFEQSKLEAVFESVEFIGRCEISTIDSRGPETKTLPQSL